MPIVIEGGINIGPGISIGGTATPAPALNPVLSLDAGNPASYPGAGGYSTWTDTVGSMTFTLVNGPTYNSANGGYIQFNPSAGQYAASSTNLGTLANWSIEAWHYYDGTNTAAAPNIFTEYSYAGGTINLGLGAANSGDTTLQAWWYGAGFHATPAYTLTPGNWYQIVGTFDGTTLNLYVNNTLVETAIDPPGGAANPAIGYGLMTRWDAGGLWGGKLAILNVYDTDIGAGGVTTSWNANKARFGLGPTPGVNNATGYTEMSPPVVAGMQTEDPTATINSPTGFTINDDTKTGIAIQALSASNQAWFATYGTGTKTVTWGAGSTVASSTIQVVTNSGALLVFYVQGQTGAATYNYPFTFS